MSGKLRSILDRHLETRGRKKTIAELMVVTGKGHRTIERWIDGQSNPDSGNSYLIALACGCSTEEASALAGLDAPPKARVTA
jgi:hypothetical protein